MADVLNRPRLILELAAWAERNPPIISLHFPTGCHHRRFAFLAGILARVAALLFLALGGTGVLFHLERGRCARRVRRPSISGRRAPSCVHFVKLQDTWAGSRRSTIRRAHLRWGLVGRRPFEVIPRLRRGLTIRGPLRLVSGFGWGLTCSALPLCLATRLCRGLACARWSLFVNLESRGSARHGSREHAPFFRNRPAASDFLECLG
mmetsp:Transcript_75159/g.176315  ORF Transcript_75159/g.176315 Transcript_75159/m.176315 type:complete len:206 (+) Transcript_75159:296-913(+)